jgi:hypothetical protein
MAAIDLHRLRILAIAGILALVPVLIILIWAVAPIWSSIAEAENDTISTRQLQELAAEKPAYHAVLLQAEHSLVSSGVLYSESSPELASAQLQDTLQALVAQAGGQIQSTAIGTPQTAHGLEELSVTASLTLPPSQLASLLTSFEVQKPYLVIQSVDIRSSDYGEQSGLLSIQLQVNGYSNAQ